RHAHVVVRTGSDSPSLVGRALEAAGLERHIGLVVPGFLAGLVAAAGSDLLYAAPRELARPLAHRLGLHLAAPPIAVPAVPVVAYWHVRLQTDPGQKWFRGIVAEQVGRTLRS